MRSYKFFKLCVVFSAIATAACVAAFLGLWIAAEINKPLCLISSIISITSTLALLGLEVIIPAYITIRKKAKKLLIPMTAVALLGNILGLILLEYAMVSQPALTGIYGGLSLLTATILFISAVYYSRFR